MRTIVESSFSVGLLVLVPTLDSLRKPCWTGALWTGYLPISGSPWMCSFEPGSLATNSRMLPGFGSDDGSESWRTQICKGANIEKKVDDEPSSCATIACTYSKPFQSFDRVLCDEAPSSSRLEVPSQSGRIPVRECFKLLIAQSRRCRVSRKTQVLCA